MAILEFNTPPANRPAGKKLKMALATVAIATSLTLSSTLAANINLNNDSNVEFGQGVVATTACDNSIIVTPISTFVNTTGAGEHRFSGLSLSDVDTTDDANDSQGCAAKLFTIKAYKSNGDQLSPIYTIAVKLNGNFISEDGVATAGIGSDISSSSTLSFTSATIAADDVFRITIESSEIPNCYGQGGAVDGLNPCTAAVSGYQLSQDYPLYTSGSYWIKSASMPNPLQMYVDMTEEGGGYDFYFITGGPSVSYVTDTNGGTPLGLDLVMPRSKYHWRAMQNAVINARPSGTFDNYFATSYGIYRNTGAYGGDFGNAIMRSTDLIGGAAWRVKDGGRWWLRDTTYGEPNGDYTLNAFLGGGMNESWNLDELTFNDSWDHYFTGNYYLVSTNAKP
jgi:hypothetical protein